MIHRRYNTWFIDNSGERAADKLLADEASFQAAELSREWEMKMAREESLSLAIPVST